MQLLDPIYDGGIAEMMNRICGTTSAVYSNKAKVVDINSAIDKYFHIGGYQFEDSNQTAAPIETIDLVDGTGRYALEDLTSELLNFLRVEIVNNDDTEKVIYPNRLSNVSGAYDKYNSSDGIPSEYFKIGKYIDLKPAPNYDKTAGLKIYFDRPASKYTFVTCTATVATDKINATAHGLSNGDAVIFETDGTVIGGLTADTVVYYVINKADDTFEVSTIIGGTKVTITDAQAASNHKFLEVSRVPGIPTIHHDYLARKASLNFMKEDHPNINKTLSQIARDENDIKQFFGRRNKDEWKGLTMRRTAFR